KAFGLSIDDYGTGYSSMQQLARIPFTELKLDQSFVTNCAANLQHQAIIESSLDMARRLHLKTVAEGVETLADWTFLRDLGCGAGQGYFIAKPLPPGDLLRWAEAWRAPEESGRRADRGRTVPRGRRRLSRGAPPATMPWSHVRTARPGTPSSS